MSEIEDAREAVIEAARELRAARQGREILTAHNNLMAAINALDALETE